MSLSFDHVVSGMLFRLLTLVWNLLSPFDFYNATKRMRLDLIFVALPFYRVTEIDCSFSGGSNDFVS